LHDELGQALTGLKATLSAVPPSEFAARRPACLQLLDEAIGNVRELSQLLRPVILDDFSLVAALRWLTERFQERTRIQVEVIATWEGRLADEVETHLFRITQEALTNVARHAGATHVQVTLAQQGRELSLTIGDNGGGLSALQSKVPSLGLVGMRARAEQLGGVFFLANEPSGGVRVTVRVPIRLPQVELEESYA
jgi:signal transduction histidine kinase